MDCYEIKKEEFDYYVYSSNILLNTIKAFVSEMEEKLLSDSFAELYKTHSLFSF
jgi:hypothetical protein